MTSQRFPTGRATQAVTTRQEAAYVEARDRQDQARQRLEQSRYGLRLIENIDRIGRGQ
jgi:DNA-dependent RNA polymerase auxiliary subunit epsilon